jgi:hypothetical protein
MELEKVTFTLEGDPVAYTLMYDFNEIAEAEGVTGANLLQAISDMRNMTAVQMRGLLYASLKRAHPQVLLVEAGTLLSRDSVTVTKALAKLLGADDETAAKKRIELMAKALGIPVEEVIEKLSAAESLAAGNGAD